MEISAVTGAGVDVLVEKIYEVLQSVPKRMKS